MDLTRLFVENGADVTARDKDGSTPLELAVQEGNADLVRLLAEYGADATARVGDRSTPLHMTRQNGSEELAHSPVEHITAPAARNEDGSSTRSDLAVRDAREDLAILPVKWGHQYIHGLLRPIMDQFLSAWQWVASSLGMA